jgi:hypothetical protein
MGVRQTVGRLYFLPHQVEYLRKGEVALGQTDEEKGHVCVCDIPFDWIVGYSYERSGKQLQYLEVQKKPLITNLPSQGPRWVIAEDDRLVCIDNGARIIIFEPGEGYARVDYRGKELNTILFVGRRTKGKSALDDCREYLKRLARFMGAMPQREDIEASIET